MAPKTASEILDEVNQTYVSPQIPTPDMPEFSYKPETYRPKVSSDESATERPAPSGPAIPMPDRNLPTVGKMPQPKTAGEILDSLNAAPPPRSAEAIPARTSVVPSSYTAVEPVVKPPERTSILKELGKGMVRGGLQFGEMAGGIAALAGAETAGKKMIESVGEMAKPYEATVADYKEISGLHDALLYAAHGLGTIIPTIALSVATGGIGGFLGKGVAQRALMAKFGEAGVKQMGMKAIRDAAFKSAATRMGATAGAAASSYAMETGQIGQAQLAEGKGMNPLTALAFAIPAAALDVFPEWALARRLGILQSAKKEVGPAMRFLAEGATGPWYSRIAKEAAKQFSLEAPTEGAQSILERMGSGQNPFSKEGLNDIINSFLIGGIGGAVFGGVGGVFAKPGKVTPEVRPPSQTTTAAPPEATPPPVISEPAIVTPPPVTTPAPFAPASQEPQGPQPEVQKVDLGETEEALQGLIDLPERIGGALSLGDIEATFKDENVVNVIRESNGLSQDPEIRPVVVFHNEEGTQMSLKFGAGPLWTNLEWDEPAGRMEVVSHFDEQGQERKIPVDANGNIDARFWAQLGLPLDYHQPTERTARKIVVSSNVLAPSKPIEVKDVTEKIQITPEISPLSPEMQPKPGVPFASQVVPTTETKPTLPKRVRVDIATDLTQGAPIPVKGVGGKILASVVRDDPASLSEIKNVRISGKTKDGIDVRGILTGYNGDGSFSILDQNGAVHSVPSDNLRVAEHVKPTVMTQLVNNKFRADAPGSNVTQPSRTYQDQPNPEERETNAWVRQSDSESNANRVLLVQFDTHLINTDPDPRSSDYYDKLYSGTRSGYSHPMDFWEIPQWVAIAANNLPNSDFYVVRNIDEAVKFLNDAKYGRVAFSALDVNSNLIQQIISKYSGDVAIGGYTDLNKFKVHPGVKVYGSMERFVSEYGVKFKDGTDYRHFGDTQVVPRLCLSIGCLHSCAFCGVAPHGKVEEAEPGAIRNQIKSIIQLRPKLVYLNDKTFGQSKNFSMLPSVYKELKDNIPGFEGFVVQTTATQFLKLDDTFLSKSGIQYVELGVESYNDGILAENKKPHRVKTIDAAMDKARANNLAVIPNVIIGMPQETEASYTRTMEFLQRNSDIISHVNAYNLAIYEGTPLADKITNLQASDLDENRIERSFHANPGIHQDFADALYAYGTKQLDKHLTPRTILASKSGPSKYLPAAMIDGVLHVGDGTHVGLKSAMSIPAELLMNAKDVKIGHVVIENGDFKFVNDSEIGTKVLGRAEYPNEYPDYNGDDLARLRGNHLARIIRNIPQHLSLNLIWTEDDLPADIKEKIGYSLGPTGARGYLDYTGGRIFIMMDKIHSMRALDEVIFHELVGHYGIIKLFGRQLYPFMDKVWSKYGEAGMADIARTYLGKDWKNNINIGDNRILIAMEKIAKMSETHTDPTMWNQFIDLVMRLFRGMGLTHLKLRDSEISMVLHKSRNLVAQEALANTGARATERIGAKPFDVYANKSFTSETPSDIAKWPEGIPRVQGVFYNGLQEFPPELGMNNAHVFTDDKTGSTFMVESPTHDKITTERDRIRNKFAAFDKPLFSRETLPSDVSETENLGRWGLWRKAREGKNEGFVVLGKDWTATSQPLEKPFTKLQEILGIPSWIAMEYAHFKPVFEVEMERGDRNNANRMFLMNNPETNVGDNPFVAARHSKPLWKLIIWSDVNNVYLHDDTMLQEQANKMGLGQLTSEEMAGYHGWKKGMDRAVDFQISELKDIFTSIYADKRWGSQIVGIINGTVSPGSVTFADTPEGKADLKEFKDALQATDKRFQQLAALETKLKALNFYVPRTRGSGDYVVRVFSTETDEEGNPKKYQVWRLNAQNQTEAEKQRLILAANPDFAGMEITKSYEPGASEVFYERFDPATMQGFLDVSLQRAQRKQQLSPEEANKLWEAVTQSMEDEIMSRGFRETHLRRMGGTERVIGGYQTEKLGEVFFRYMSGVAGSMSKLRASHEFYRAIADNIDATTEPDLFNYSSRYTRDMLRNSDATDQMINKWKMIPFAWYLTSNLRLTAAQFVQNYMTAAPILSRYVDEWQVKGPGGTRRIEKAMRDVVNHSLKLGTKLTESEAQMLQQAYLQGETAARQMQEMKGRMEGGWLSQTLTKVMDVAAIPFSGMEKINRQTALLAMFRLAKEHGMTDDEAYGAAKEFTRNTHYAYGKSNLPQLLREGTTFSKIAGLGYVFRSFTHNYIKSMLYYSRTKEGKLSLDVVGRSLAFMVVVGGAAAVPFLDDLLDELEKLTGSNYRTSMKQTLEGIGGKMLGEIGMQGVPALVGTDISGSIKIGIPFLGDSGNTVYGVWGGLRDKGLKAINEALDGETWRAMEAVLPTGLESPLKAMRQMNEGITTSKGKHILDENGEPIKLTAGEAALQAASFRPARVASISRERRVEANVVQHFNDRRSRIHELFRRATTEADYESLAKDVEKFNMEIQKYNGIIAPISAQSIRQALQPEQDYMKYNSRIGG